MGQPRPGRDAQPDDETLAALVKAVPRVAMVTAHEVLPTGDSPAALLVWGRHQPTRRWAAGVAFIYTTFRGGPIQALVTVWLPARQVSRQRAQLYGDVPRVVLAGVPEQWPRLPPVYPSAGQRWIEAHHHAVRVDPARRYGLTPEHRARGG